MKLWCPPIGLASPVAALGAPAVLALTIACVAAQAQAPAAWTPLGPPGGSVSTLLVDPAAAGTVYAGTPENGVFFSSDGGATWIPANTGLATAAVGRQMLLGVQALASDAGHVYAATDAGLYAAPLGATPTWSALAATGAAAPVTLLAFDATSGLLVAASPASDGVSVAGVYVAAGLATQSAGLAWTFVALPSASAGLVVDGLAVVPPSGLATSATLLASAGGRLWSAPLTSAFAMAPAWTDADPMATLSGGSLAALAFRPEFLEAFACSAGSAWVSGNPLDAQALWSPATVEAGMVAPVCNAFSAIPVSAGGQPQALLATDQGVFVSVDGVDFKPTLAVGPSAWADAFAVGQPPGAMSSLLYVGTGFGVVTSPVAAVQAGAGWTASNGPASAPTGAPRQRLDNAGSVDTAVIGTRLFAAAQGAQYTEVFASSDSGATWAPTGIGGLLAAGSTVNEMLADTANQILYAGTSQGLLAYDPVAATWAAVDPGVLSTRVSALGLGADALFAGTDNGVYALPLGRNPAGATPVAAGLAGSVVRSLLVTPSVVIAGTIDATDDNYVFFTSEAAAAQGTGLWQAFGVGSAGTSRITSLLLVDTNLLAGTNGNLVLVASANSAWTSANTSTDAAQQISDPFGAVTSLYSDGTTIFAATGSQGVFVSPVGASYTWTPYAGAAPTALPTMEVRKLRPGDGVVYASTRAGVAATADPVLSSTPPPSSPASGGTGSGSGSGGGAASPWWLVALLLASTGLRRRAGR
jgi:hypothetical protein